MLTSFSGKKISQSFNECRWTLSYSESKGSSITKSYNVCTIQSPQIFSKVNLTYVSEIGGTVNGSYVTASGDSATFKIVGKTTGTTYKTKTNVSSISLSDIEEPVTVKVTWAGKISNSEYAGVFYMTNVTLTVK